MNNQFGGELIEGALAVTVSVEEITSAVLEMMNSNWKIVAVRDAGKHRPNERNVIVKPVGDAVAIDWKRRKIEEAYGVRP